MKPVLVFGTAGTQMPPFMAILIRWILSSQHRTCQSSSSPACVPGQRTEDAEASPGLVGSLGALHAGTGTTVVLISTSMCDIGASWLRACGLGYLGLQPGCQHGGSTGENEGSFWQVWNKPFSNLLLLVSPQSAS